MQTLLQETIRQCLAPNAIINDVRELPMTGRGYSGAAVRRFLVVYTTEPDRPQFVSLLVKQASLVERRALVHLYGQGQALLPFSYAPDLVTPSPAPVCMKYLLEDPGAMSKKTMRKAAQGLASIHARNLGRRELLDWAPPVDRDYFNSGYVLGTWRTFWEKSLAKPTFAAEFEKYDAPLNAAAGHFLSAMEDLWQEGDSLTLIHGDLHAGNIVVEEGEPYLVDWDQAGYGSFYIDLPNFFTPDNVRYYQKALAGLGVEVSPQAFSERYREAGRFVGFKYMAFVMGQWAERDRPGSRVREQMQNLVRLALEGAEI